MIFKELTTTFVPKSDMHCRNNPRMNLKHLKLLELIGLVLNVNWCLLVVMICHIFYSTAAYVAQFLHHILIHAIKDLSDKLTLAHTLNVLHQCYFKVQMHKAQSPTTSALGEFVQYHHKRHYK